MAKNGDWFDDYMIYKMTTEESNTGNGGGNSGNVGCLSIVLIGLLVLGLITSLFK